METPFPAYQGEEPYVFVSYSHEDSSTVFDEIRWLKDQGFNIWYDEGISPGHEWRDELAGRIAQSSLFLYFVTPSSAASEHCRREVNFAIDEGKQTLVVHLAQTDLPEGLRLALNSFQSIMRYDLTELDYRIKLLRGVGAHADRGVVKSEPSRQKVGFSAKAVGLTAILSVVVGGLLALALTPGEAPDELAQPKRFQLILPDTLALVSDISLIPDGTGVTFYATTGDTSQAFHRHFNTLELVPIKGTVTRGGARDDWLRSISTSPGGDWIAFYDPDERALKKTALGGGNTSLITDRGGPWGLDWGPEGSIVFKQYRNPGLSIVSADGGTSRQLTFPPEGLSHMTPAFTPTGDIIYTQTEQVDSPLGEIHLHSMVTGESLHLGHGSYPRLSVSGHLLFLREGDLWAAKLNSSRDGVQNQRRVIENVTAFDIAPDGTLAYIQTDEFRASFLWVDQDGNEEVVVADTPRNLCPRVSPNGRQLVVGENPEGYKTNFWLFDADRRTWRELTRGDDVDRMMPIWSPDGRRVVYGETVDGHQNLFVLEVSGTKPPERLTRANADQYPTSWSKDGTSILIHEVIEKETGQVTRISEVPLSDSSSSVVLLDAGFQPALSPDGRLLAYTSYQSGRRQVQLRPYPNVDDDVVTISAEGGWQPRWSTDGRRLFYRVPAGFMAVSVESGSTLEVSSPSLFVSDRNYWTYPCRGYDVGPDGSRLLVSRITDENAKVVVAFDWLNDLGNGP